MDPNTVFDGINDSQFKKIKEMIDSQFKYKSNELHQGVKESFIIDSTEGKISLTYYNKGKVMLQSSPSNTVYAKLVADLANTLSKDPTKKVEVIPKEENELISDYYIGCDESGAGESFGSMFLGCAVIHKDNLESICNIVKGRNIRELSQQEVNEILNAIENKFDSDIKIYSPSVIDDNSKNVLLDRGYKDLISKKLGGKSNVSVIIDDYGIRYELTSYVNELKKKGHEIIVKTKADEQYTACKIASLVARKARMDEIENINKTNVLVDNETKDMIVPGTGAASNPMTEKYLAMYRKKMPDAEFPSFVRRKWANIRKIEQKYPRRIVGLFVICQHCTKELRRIDVTFDKNHGSRFYCPLCSNLISIQNFRAYFTKNVIVLDTSTLISRILSKDLKSNQYFKDNDFLLPSYVYEELDTKQPDIKRGAQKEITELVAQKSKCVIGFDDIDTHLIAHGVPNDKKLLKVLDVRNACLLTKDMTMATFAEIDHFVFYVKGM